MDHATLQVNESAVCCPIAIAEVDDWCGNRHARIEAGDADAAAALGVPKYPGAVVHRDTVASRRVVARLAFAPLDAACNARRRVGCHRLGVTALAIADRGIACQCLAWLGGPYLDLNVLLNLWRRSRKRAWSDLLWPCDASRTGTEQDANQQDERAQHQPPSRLRYELAYDR